MDRVINYSGSIPRSVDLLWTNRNVMTALGMLAQELFGTPVIASGFACAPTVPAGLNVLVGPGRVYSQQETDPLQYSTLPADTTDLIIKQGILNTSTTLSCPAPGTSGQSINYLIEAAFEEQDTNALVLPYYNSNNPSQPYSGPNNSGDANYTTRQDTVQLQVKAGTPATTGSQVTPAPDTGYVGLWVITVAYGQTTITSGNIGQYAGAPLLGGSLLQALQGNAFTYAADVGAANAYVANFAPAITTLVDGMTLEFQAAFANTGVSTFAPNGVAAQPIVGGAHLALQGGEIVSGSKCIVMWKANISSWVLIDSTGGAVQVGTATGTKQAVQRGSLLQVSPVTQKSTLGALTANGSWSVTTTITAPCAGFVYANAAMNPSAQFASPVALVMSINGTTVATDTTQLSQSQYAEVAVTAGEVVTVQTQISSGAVAPAAAVSIIASAFFLPTP